MEDNNYSQSAQPPPLPRTGKSFAEHAAQASFIAPMIAIGLGITYGTAFAGTTKDSSHATAAMIVGLAACLMIFCGFVFGIIALCGIKQHGAKGILGRAITGIILSSIFGVMGVAGFFAAARARERAQNYQKLEQAARDLREENREAVGKSNSLEGAEERLSKFKKVLDQGAQAMSGDDALAMQATSSCLEQMQQKLKPFQAVSKELMSVHVLQPSDVQVATDFEPQKELLRKFLDANEDLRSVTTNLVPLYRAELKKRHLSTDKVELAVSNFKKGMQSPEILGGVRDCDARIGDNMLKVVDLLQSNWGKWKYDPAKGKIIFTDNAALETFNGYIQEIQTAGKEEVALQRQLLK